MFPVGLVTDYCLSTPVVKNHTVIGFYDGWPGGRRYPVDMAGFAINIEFLLSRPHAQFIELPGYQETKFLETLEPFELKDIEPMANYCTELLAFHTKYQW